MTPVNAKYAETKFGRRLDYWILEVGVLVGVAVGRVSMSSESTVVVKVTVDIALLYKKKKQMITNTL